MASFSVQVSLTNTGKIRSSLRRENSLSIGLTAVSSRSLLGRRDKFMGLLYYDGCLRMDMEWSDGMIDNLRLSIEIVY